MKRFLAALLLAAFAAISPVSANFLITPGSITTIFAIDASNQGTSLCAGGTECYANVLINPAGAPIGISGTPIYVNGSGGTFPVTGTFWQATQPVSGTFWQATQPVSGTFWQATQPVSLASGAAAAGSLAAGSAVDGWDLSVQTTTASAGCGSGTGVNPCLKQIDVDVKSSIAAGTNNIGYMPNHPGAAAFAPTQASVTTSATPIVSARTGVPGTGRVQVTVENTTTTPVYLGGSGVTTSTGAFLAGIVGAQITIPTTAAVYGIVATGSATVTAIEAY